jgi:hypothetical protein
MQIELTGQLPVSVDEGFSYVTDIHNWPAYWPGLLEVRDAQHTSWAKPGDTARVVVRILGRPVELLMTLDELNPSESSFVYRTEARGILPTARHERRLRSSNSGCEYTLAAEYQPRRGPRGVTDRLIVPRAVRRVFADTLANLERIFRAAAP